MYTDSKQRTWRVIEREDGSVSIYYTKEDSPEHYVVFDTLDVEKENDADASPARKASRDELLKLIQHCWLHSGYKNCGYKQMTMRQKKLFHSILCTDIEKGV